MKKNYMILFDDIGWINLSSISSDGISIISGEALIGEKMLEEFKKCSTFIIPSNSWALCKIHENTMLVDRPEKIMHPRQQNVLAKMIVKDIYLDRTDINNIIINTNSPYLIRAIQIYAAKNNIAHKCHYYLKELGEADEIKLLDCTDNIEKIYAPLAQPLEDERWDCD